MKKRMAETKDYLKNRTGKDSQYWLKRIGILISKHAYWDKEETRKAKAAKRPLHMSVKLEDWVTHFTDEVIRRRVEGLNSRYDGNMRFASVVSFILMKWWVRLVRAKCYDPRRRLKDRKKGMLALNGFCREVMGFMMDESEDHKHFPDQKWDPPFTPDAKNGKYW